MRNLNPEVNKSYVWTMKNNENKKITINENTKNAIILIKRWVQYMNLQIMNNFKYIFSISKHKCTLRENPLQQK